MRAVLLLYRSRFTEIKARAVLDLPKADLELHQLFRIQFDDQVLLNRHRQIFA